MTILLAAVVACTAVGARALVAQQGHGASMRPMYHSPRWSPDGKSIVVVGKSSTGSRVLLLSSVGGEHVAVPTGRIDPMAADWTAAGRILLMTDAGDSYSIDRDGKNLRPYTRDTVTAANRDSSVLLFESPRAGLSAIFATDKRRSGARQLTSGFWAEQASFSPDGRSIVFEKRVDPNDMFKSDIVTMALDGSAQKVIAAGTDPSWSPDGRLILFKTPDPTGKLWVSTVVPSTGVVQRLAKGVHPQWSPDGREIVFMRDEPNGDNDVYLMTREGKSIRCLTCALATSRTKPR